MHDEVLLQTPGNVGDRLRRLDDEHAVEALLEQFVLDLSPIATTRSLSPSRRASAACSPSKPCSETPVSQERGTKNARRETSLSPRKQNCATS